VPPGAYVAPGAVLAPDAELAPGVVIHEGVLIGGGVRIGAGAVVHPATEIGERCVIEEGAVLGKRPRLRSGSRAAGAEIRALALQPRVTVCCGAVVYAGARIESGAIIGDHAQVRERARVGRETVVGSGSWVDFDAEVGARVLIQTGVYLPGRSVVEDDVFLGPGVVTTNDNTMGRHQRGEQLKGPVLRRACRVGAAAVLLPGIEIGEEAFVAAGALVTHDVGPRQVVMGVPARAVREVPERDLIERWR
jgi:acetyltransferase-like isoleucine patch superfamily enzyme